MYQLIVEQQQLTSVLDVLQQAQTCYLDTEFIRQRTRYAQIALLQLNIAGEVFLIDPLSVDLSDFWLRLLHCPQVILHSCNEDVSLIDYHLKQLQCPQRIHRIFDTQLGLEFLGYGISIGYQSALEQCLNISINKQEARSNWLARPLTPQQLEYAYHDVYYLPQLMDYIVEQLHQRNIYQFVLEDCRDLAHEIVHEIPLERLYLQYARSSHSPRQLAQLQQLTQWREQSSIERNVPPSFIMKNEQLLNLVKCQPKNEQEVASLLDKKSIAHYLPGTVLRLLYKLPNKKDYPVRIQRANAPSKAVQQEIEQLIQETAKQLQMPASCLMRKKWLNDLYQFIPTLHQINTLPDFLLGWRYDIITRPILQRLSA